MYIPQSKRFRKRFKSGNLKYESVISIIYFKFTKFTSNAKKPMPFAVAE